MSGFGGKKREMSQEEIVHYTEELGGEYVIGQQLGRSGAMSSAYLLTDKNGNNCVLKIPNSSDKLDEWNKAQERAINLQERYVGDYQGAVHVPKLIRKGKDFIVEELATGKEFFASVYDTLTLTQKKKVAHDLAEFLNASHQRTMTGKTVILYPHQQDRVSWQDTYNYFAPVLTENEKKELQSEIQRHNQKEEAEVLAFCDYRFSNMLWDDKKSCLSIIDFGCTKNASVYSEFTPSAGASARISYRFLRDVINAYNKCPKQHPLSIDLETVRHNCFLGIYHEYARCNIGKNPPEKYLSMLRADLKDLKKLTPSTLQKTLEKGTTSIQFKKGKEK